MSPYRVLPIRYTLDRSSPYLAPRFLGHYNELIQNILDNFVIRNVLGSILAWAGFPCMACIQTGNVENLRFAELQEVFRTS